MYFLSFLHCAFCLCLYHLSNIFFSLFSFIFHSVVLVLFTSFHFHIIPLRTILPLPFGPVPSIYSMCFAFIAFLVSTLHLCLQFLSSVFYLSQHHLTVTLDVFHFCFSTPICIFILHWCSLLGRLELLSSQFQRVSFVCQFVLILSSFVCANYIS